MNWGLLGSDTRWGYSPRLWESGTFVEGKLETVQAPHGRTQGLAAVLRGWICVFLERRPQVTGPVAVLALSETKGTQ